MSRNRILLAVVALLVVAIGWYLSGAVIIQDRGGRVAGLTLSNGTDTVAMTALPAGLFIGRPPVNAVLIATCRSGTTLEGDLMSAPAWLFLGRRTCVARKKRY